MQRDLCAYLNDILRAADDIELCSAGLSFDIFLAVDTVYSTVLFKFIIIGEALNKANAQFPGALNSIPDLRAVIAQRNRIIHGYFDIDAAMVWDSVKDDLPTLVKEVKRLQELHCATKL